MDLILNIIGFSCIGVLIVISEPTTKLRNFILGKHNGYLRRLLECAMCFTFNLYLFYHLIVNGDINILHAAISAIIAEIIYNKL
jgi:hypothetical protein